ncbi:DUF982 domain-containing protein [Neorhizobium galegae]|uniref:DUF982 domain-containing protein n=2 Tax=Neorhizobium galegae TaxID=399 RepID=UPI00351D3FAD
MEGWNMLVNRWGKPLVLERDGLRVTITSAEEGVNWLAHEPGQANQAWKHAWQTCRAVHEGRLPSEEARSAVLLAAANSRH